MIKIYHNPRCSKSRQALKILEETGKEFQVIEYLKESPSLSELELFLKTFGDTVIRKKEEEFKPYKNKELSLKEWAKVLFENPRLIERPIVVNDHKLAIGRPPENIKLIL